MNSQMYRPKAAESHLQKASPKGHCWPCLPSSVAQSLRRGHGNRWRSCCEGRWRHRPMWPGCLVEPGLGWSCPSSKNGGLAQNFPVRTVETIVIHSARIGNRFSYLVMIFPVTNGHNMAINAEKHYFQKHPGDFWWSVPQLKVGESNQQATSIEPANIPMVECRNKDMNICGCEHIIPCTNWDPINSATANLQQISYWQLYIWSGNYAQIELESWKLGGK